MSETGVINNECSEVISKIIRVANNVSMSEDSESDFESTNSILVNNQPSTSNPDNWHIVTYRKRLGSPIELRSGQAKTKEKPGYWLNNPTKTKKNYFELMQKVPEPNNQIVNKPNPPSISVTVYVIRLLFHFTISDAASKVL